MKSKLIINDKKYKAVESYKGRKPDAVIEIYSISSHDLWLFIHMYFYRVLYKLLMYKENKSRITYEFTKGGK